MANSSTLVLSLAGSTKVAEQRAFEAAAEK
jgi:hypothetical protein